MIQWPFHSDNIFMQFLYAVMFAFVVLFAFHSNINILTCIERKEKVSKFPGEGGRETEVIKPRMISPSW